MKTISFSLIAFCALCATVALPTLAYADGEQVINRTETTYSKQNERVIDGYTPLDPLDNSVKTNTNTVSYKVPGQPTAPALVQNAQPTAYPVQAAAYAQPTAYPAYAQPMALPVQATAPQPIPANIACMAGTNCPSSVSSIQYTQSPVKVQYPVVRQYPVSVEYPVTVNRDVTVRQPVIVQQPVVVQKPVMVNQPVLVERAPAYVQQQPVVMQQQPSYVQQKPVIVQAPAGQVLPPCTTGNCQ